MRKVDRRHSELLRQTLRYVFLGHKPELDERLAELAAGVLLELERFLELIGTDQARLRQ